MPGGGVGAEGTRPMKVVSQPVVLPCQTALPALLHSTVVLAVLSPRMTAVAAVGYSLVSEKPSSSAVWI